jgi:hypothetical protein
MAKAQRHWHRHKAEEASSESALTRFFVHNGLPVKIEFYDANTPKCASIPVKTGDEWTWQINNDYINLATDKRFKNEEVTPASFKTVVARYQRDYTAEAHRQELS